MDFLKSQFDRIQQQLAALTPTQKMLTGTLVAIMVMTLVWWSRYAGTAEMEPVLDQALSQEEMGRIQQTLKEKQIDYQVSSANRILVSSDRKMEALSILGFNGALPKDTATGFDEMIKELSPWDGASRQNVVFNHAKELTLKRIISKFPDVAGADVVIDPRAERHIGADVEPVAAITVQMRGGINPNKQLAKAAASLVAGAQSGLALKNIKVVINGLTQKIQDGQSDDALDGGTVMEIRQSNEQMLQKKVVDLLADIPGVLVSVNVKVDNQSTLRERTTVDQKNSFNAISDSTTENHEQNSAAAAPAEPGTVPNTNLPLGLSGPGAGESTSTDTKENNKYLNVPALTKDTTHIPGGLPTAFSASVRIPRSHMVFVAKNMGDGKDPDAQTLKQTIEEERTKTANQVYRAIGLASPSDVAVDVYADMMPVASAEPAVTAASTFTLALGGHFKEIALGALAIVSLFMVSSMVKKSAPIPAIAVSSASTAALPRNILSGAEIIAGEAGDGGTLLNAVEMDDESVRNQQMMEQVATLVDENPDTAATLVKRWMNRG